MGNPNRSSQITSDQKLIAGLKKHLSKVLLTIAGKSWTEADLEKLLQAEIDTTDAAQAAKAVWQTAVKTDQTQWASSKELKLQLRQAILVMFASQPDTLADFGLAPRKTRAKLTAAKQVLQVARSKATRKARGTVGPVKRLETKGNVSSVEIVPTTGGQQTNGSSSQQIPKG